MIDINIRNNLEFDYQTEENNDYTSCMCHISEECMYSDMQNIVVENVIAEDEAIYFVNKILNN